MFWKINFRQPSAIDGLLEKEDCTLMEILDEDDVLQECKTQNKKLVDFLCKKEHLEQLVGYVCVEPSADDEDKVRFKYPHLACEILTAEIYSVVEALACPDTYLPMLWSFLDREAPLNPLTASFISKVLIMLLNQRTSVLLDYIRNREGFIDSFLSHLGTSAITDLLLQMIVPSDEDQSKADVTTWLKDVGIIQKLLDCIHPGASMDQCINASQAVCDMIRISRDSSQTSGPSPLLTALESEDTIQKLLDNMFATDNPPDWTIINGTMILLTTLERRISTGYSPTTGSFSEESNLSWDQAIERTLSCICPRVKQFHELLSRKPSCSEPVLFSVGVLDPPLGNMRLRVVQLFSALLQSRNVNLHREIIRLRSCSILLDLFFQYPWNNFLHTYVEASITAALSLSSNVPLDTNDDTGQSDDSISLRQHLLKDCELVQRILAGADFNEERMKDTRGCRQGYMGHLIRLTNQIAGNARALSLDMAGSLSHNRSLEEARLQEELDEETYRLWSEFITGPLTDMNKKNNTNLGGNRPINSSIEDSDEEFDPLNMPPDNELEKAYQQYQEISFTNQFMDEFGADDDLEPAPMSYSATYGNITSISCTIDANEEHTQAMAGFDAAYADKIHQFDDESESEDESSTWVEKELSPTDLHSSEEEEEEGGITSKRSKGFPSESSDDDDYIGMTGIKGRPLIIEEKKNGNGTNDLGVISWRSEFTTDEDLSGVQAIETTGGALKWTQEPPLNTEDTNWAQFGEFSPGNESNTVVTTTYVSVSELEGSSNDGTGHYTRLDGSEKIMLNPHLQDSHSSDSSDEDTRSSDDSYDVNPEGDSGNPLLDPPTPEGTPSKPQSSDSGDASLDELTENYRFLSSKGLITDNNRVITTSSTTHSTDDDHRLEDKNIDQNPKEDSKVGDTPPVN